MENITTDLIKKAQNGDFSALEKLLKASEKEIYALLYYLAKEEIDPEDIIQEVLVKINKNLKNLKEPKNFKGWLTKIAMRQYYDYLRKNKKRCHKSINELENEFKDKKRNPIEDCIGCEIIESIKKSVSRLDEPYRAAILMREFEGMSYEEIANLTNSNIGTVKSRISRARHRLKEDIKEYME